MWQLLPYRRFDADDVEYFFALLPDALDGLPLRHVLEPRHAGTALRRLRAPGARLQRRHGVHRLARLPQHRRRDGRVVYARLMRSQGDEPTGYSAAELARWAARIRTWARGESPADLPLIDTPAPAAQPRGVFVYFIAAAKARNPRPAQALVARLNAS